MDGEVTQYRDWGIPLGRRFRALKLWFHLRLDGPESIRERLREDLANAAWLAGEVSGTATREAIQAAQTAATMAVIMPALIVTTTSGR